WRLPEDRGAGRRPHPGDPAPAHPRPAGGTRPAGLAFRIADPPRRVTLARVLRAAARPRAHRAEGAADEEPVGQPGHPRPHQPRPRAGARTARRAALRAGARTLPPQGAQPRTALLGAGGRLAARLARAARLAAWQWRHAESRAGSAGGGRGGLTPAKPDSRHWVMCWLRCMLAACSLPATAPCTFPTAT